MKSESFTVKCLGNPARCGTWTRSEVEDQMRTAGDGGDWVSWLFCRVFGSRDASCEVARAFRLGNVMSMSFMSDEGFVEIRRSAGAV